MSSEMWKHKQQKHGCIFSKNSAKDLNLWVTPSDVWWHFPCDCVWHGWCRSVTARHNNAVTSVHHCHCQHTIPATHNSERVFRHWDWKYLAVKLIRMWRGGCKVEGNVRSMTRHDLMTFMSCHHCSLCDSPLFSSVRLHSFTIKLINLQLNCFVWTQFRTRILDASILILTKEINVDMGIHVLLTGALCQCKLCK